MTTDRPMPLYEALGLAISLMAEKREELGFCASDGDTEEDRGAAETEAEEMAEAYDVLVNYRNTLRPVNPFINAQDR